VSVAPAAADCDYVVIGGGHNGLSAACTLSAAGHSVVVLEQRPHLGGLANSGAFLDAAPNHILSTGTMDYMFMSCTSIISDLRLHRYGYSGGQTMVLRGHHGIRRCPPARVRHRDRPD
jgi:phytoene dehydrogenase-like protein